MNLLLLGSLNSSTNSETTLVKDINISISNLSPFLNSIKSKLSTYLVLELGQLETIKVSQVSTNLTLFELLGPGSLGPLVNSLVLLQSLLKSRLTDSTRKILEDKRSQDHATEGESLTSDTSGGTIDKSTVVVNNVNNDSQLTGISTVVNEDNTTNFDLTLESTLLK